MTDEVEEFLRVLGPFYELIEEKKKISQISDLSTGGGGVYSPAVTPPPFTLFVCDVKNSMRSLTFFIICLLSDAQPV